MIESTREQFESAAVGDDEGPTMEECEEENDDVGRGEIGSPIALRADADTAPQLPIPPHISTPWPNNEGKKASCTRVESVAERKFLALIHPLIPEKEVT